MTARKVRSGARKPVQERSRATVEIILAAAVQVLVEEGPAALTTRRAAQRAGVSIGTLYQYFADREALLDALAERQQAEIVESCARALRREPGRALGDAARELVQALLSAYCANLPLQQTLAERGLTARAEQLRAAEARVASLLLLFLESQAVQPRRPELAAFLVTRAVQSAAFSAVLERPELAQSEELVDELTRLAVSYLAA